MPEVTNIQVGDIVRIRENIQLMPITDWAPDQIPAGIYGQVIDTSENAEWGQTCYVEFYEPYEVFNELPLSADHLEIMFRLSVN